MAIPDEDVAAVRAATDLAGLIGEHTGLKRVGRRLVGLCPFHSESTPSFSVNAEEGLYYCFGCQVRGDAITFVRAIEGCSFVEAVERLAARAGLTVRNDEDPAAGAEQGHRRQLLELLEAAVAFYHARLVDGPDAGPARQYLRSRGYDGEVVRRFRLGYAGIGSGELAKALKAPAATLVAAGLAWGGTGGSPLRDAFRDRIIFPIFDPGGRAIALGGRVLPEGLRRETRDPGPKYRNSPESPVYSKRRTLYGLNWAKTEVARTGEVIVCEGYTDVIGCFRAGLPRAVATCGTALTEEHVKVLANFAKRIVLAFDADAAGQNAAARLYDWERRHGLELAVAGLPAGSDPGELAGFDPGALVAAVEHARPFLGFRVDRCVADVVGATPEVRSRAADAALAAIAEHPDEFVRSEYLMQVADRVRLEPEALRARLEQLRSRPGEAPATGSSPRPSGRIRTDRGAAPRAGRDDEPPPPEPPEDAEHRNATHAPGRRAGLGGQNERRRDGPRSGLDALALAIHRPADLAARLEEAMFADELQRRAFSVLAGASELHAAIEAADPDVGDLLARLAVAEPPAEDDIEGTVLALVRHAVEHELRAVQAEARRAEDPQGLEAAARASAFAKQELEVLQVAIGEGVNSPAAVQALDRLVAWLAQRGLEGR